MSAKQPGHAPVRRASNQRCKKGDEREVQTLRASRRPRTAILWRNGHTFAPGGFTMAEMMDCLVSYFGLDTDAEGIPRR